MAKFGKTEGRDFVWFDCPGCGEYHSLRVDGSRQPSWTFNGDYDRPTLQPSILARGERWQGHGQPSLKFVCHSFVTDGRIQFLSDSTHSLAGQTIELPDIETKPKI